MFPCARCSAVVDLHRPCPRCGWVTHPGFSAEQLAAADAKGARLVRMSTAIMAAAAAVLLGSIALGIAVSSGAIGVLGFVLGFGGLVASAVVGQIGRAHQGRII